MKESIKKYDTRLNNRTFMNKKVKLLQTYDTIQRERNF